jgi:hypothetical protein
MKLALEKVKRLGRQLKGLFPSRVPTGMHEFDVWANDIVSTYAMPTESYNSLKFTLATIIMHLGPSDAYKSKFWFALMINAAAAKQIAGAKFQEVKQEQQRRADEERRKQLEATDQGLSIVNPS